VAEGGKFKRARNAKEARRIFGKSRRRLEEGELLHAGDGDEAFVGDTEFGDEREGDGVETE
jgi:hypothetical protein